MWLLAYIPNALAYVFVSLLVCIVCFILIYVSHKLYLFINDRLQTVGDGDSHIAFQKRMHSAVTVLVLFEKCYLVMSVLRPDGDLRPKLIRYTESFDDKFSDERLKVLRTDSLNSMNIKLTF